MVSLPAGRRKRRVEGGNDLQRASERRGASTHRRWARFFAIDISSVTTSSSRFRIFYEDANGWGGGRWSAMLARRVGPTGRPNSVREFWNGVRSGLAGSEIADYALRRISFGEAAERATVPGSISGLGGSGGSCRRQVATAPASTKVNVDHIRPGRSGPGGNQPFPMASGCTVHSG